MKIRCYCIGCPKHPLFGERDKHVSWASSLDPDYHGDEAHKKTGKEVECFNPTSSKIETGRIDVDELLFNRSLHYVDGFAEVEAVWDGDTVYVRCRDEEYSDY